MPFTMQAHTKMQEDDMSRARQLGVSDAALSASRRIMVEPRDILAMGDSTLRVLQWNVLADGLSGDGFLVQDVLESPGETDKLEAVLSAMDEVKRSGGDMFALKARLETPRASKNHAAIVDWTRRWRQIKRVLADAQPDVITFQEMDHMADAMRELAELGYQSGLPNAQYVPAHTAGIAKGDVHAYVAHLERVRVAFAADLPSTSRKLALRTNPDADDNGCAIFWRAATIAAEHIDFLPIGGARCCAAVRARLRRRSDGTTFYVLCTHLKSGDGSEEEATRLSQLGSPSDGTLSLTDWLAQSMASRPTLLCLDANSSPERTEKQTVWRLLRATPNIASVWDSAFDSSGRAICAPQPVSTNKIRGPLSDQPAKIGHHAYALIDHIYFSRHFAFIRHACSPLAYSSRKEARMHLIPSLDMPSDHAPVIVDLTLPLAWRVGRVGRWFALAGAILIVGVSIQIARRVS